MVGAWGLILEMEAELIWVGIKRCISDIGAWGHLPDIQVTGAQEEVTSAGGHTGILGALKILGPWDCSELLRE